MVRVTHPPGGAPKLEESATPSAKTVRVLKPPGGGSSISFGEPNEPGIVPKSKQVPKTSPFATEETAPAPEAVEQPIVESSPHPPAEPEAVSAPPVEDSPAPTETKEDSKSNGTAECKSNGSSSNNCNDDFPSVSFDKSVGSETVAEPSISNGHKEPQQSNGTEATPVVEESFPTVVPSKAEEPAPVVESPPPAVEKVNGHTNGVSKTNGHHAETNGVESTNGVAASNEVHRESNGVATTNGHHKESNGHHEPTETPAPVSSSVETSSHKPVEAHSPPPKPERSNSTTIREQHQQGSLSRQNSEEVRQAVPRAMPSNHHMKSSIFIQEETNTFTAPPSKRSEPSPVKEKSAPFQQAPPARVRQPPGGFSAGFW